MAGVALVGALVTRSTRGMEASEQRSAVWGEKEELKCTFADRYLVN